MKVGKSPYKKFDAYIKNENIRLELLPAPPKKPNQDFIYTVTITTELTFEYILKHWYTIQYTIVYLKLKKTDQISMVTVQYC